MKIRKRKSENVESQNVNKPKYFGFYDRKGKWHEYWSTEKKEPEKDVVTDDELYAATLDMLNRKPHSKKGGSESAEVQNQPGC